MTELYERAKRAVGDNFHKSIECREAVRVVGVQGRDKVVLKYDWIVDWEPIEGLEFFDGEEFVTCSLSS